MTLSLLALPAAGFAAGYEAFSGTSTGEKPQSKIFYHDGSYWAVIKGPGGVGIYEKQGTSWNRGNFVDALLTSGGKTDVKWTGTYLFVLVYSSSPKLFKYTYDSTFRIWNLESGFPISVPKPSGSETMVLECDSTGRLWTAVEGSNDINVYYSTSADHRSWSTTPVVLRSGVGADDIASIVAFGGNKVGVFWSDQNRDEFGFRVHHDGDAPDAWDPVEVVYEGRGHADDHLNLAYDSQGRVYAITKDDSDRMAVHRRSTSGNWTTKTDVTGVDGTRGIIMVAEADAKAYVLYTRWGVSPNRIEYREAPLSSLSFSNRTTFISSSSNMNNVTGTKQILPEGNLIAMAHNSSKTLWNGWGNPGTPPGPVDVPPPGAPLALTTTPIPGSTLGALVLPFDDGSGQSASDATANGNHARLGDQTTTDAADPTWTTGIQAGALQFDGFDDYLYVADDASLDMPGSFTVEAWVRRDAATTGTLLNKGRSGERTYRVLLNAAGGIEFRWEEGNGTRHEVITGTLLDLGAWHHVACVYDQSVSQNRVYVDGVLQATGAASGVPAANARALRIGARQSSTLVDFFAGALDRLRIVPGALYTSNFVPDDGTAFERTYVRLDWSPPTSGGPAVGYQVYRSLNGGAFVNLTTVPITGTTWVDPEGLDGELCYQVTALNVESEEGPATAPACATIAPPGPPPPAAPQNLAVALQGTLPESARLTWSAPTSGAPATGYLVYRAVDGGAFAALTPAPIATLEFTDTSLQSGDHCYQVRAVDASGRQGDLSPSACVFYLPPPPPPPGAPQALTAQVSQVPGGVAGGEAAYRFDTGSGQTLEDATGNGHTGQLGSTPALDSADPAWVASPYGQALRFDGSNDRVLIADAPALQIPGSFTIEAWVSQTSRGSSQCVLSKGDSNRRNFWMQINTAGEIDFRWETASGANHGTVGNASLPLGTWHHIACVYDMAAGENRIYIDGVLDARDPDSGTPTTSTDPIYLGARLSSGRLKSFFHGDIDLVRITAGALYDADFTPPTLWGSGEMLPVVDVSWSPPASGTAASYNLYRRVGAGAFARLNVDPITTLAYTDADVFADSFCYYVTAVDAFAQEGAASDTACVGVQGPPPPPPGPPTNPSVALLATDSTRAEVRWSAPATGGAAVAYNVYRQRTGGAFALLDSATTQLASIDSALVAGEQCYRITALDADGQEGEASAAVCLSYTPPPGPPPGPPLGVQATLETVQQPGAAGGAAAWTFDDASGATAADATGNGHTAQLGNAPGADSADPTWVPGFVGTALHFDGTGDRLYVADAPDLQFAGSFTIEAWVEQDAIGGMDAILSKGDSNRRNYWMRIDRSGRIDFRWETPGGANHGTVSSTTLPPGWHHVACVYDQQAGENRIYLDGVLVHQAADSGTPVTSTDPILIGARLSGGSPKDFFAGRIDLARVSPGALYDGDFTPPQAYGTPSAQTAVRVQWSPPQSATAVAYHVYRSVDGGGATRLTTTPVAALEYLDTDPFAGTLCYRVTGLDAIGQEGAMSDSACVVNTGGPPPPPPPPPAPEPPLNLAATLVSVPAGSPGAAAWTFDDGSGQVATDASGNGHDGELGASPTADSADPVWTAGLTGGALLFDGSNDRVRVPDAPELQIAGSFTLEAWVYRGSASSSHCILSKGDSNRRNFWMRLTTAGEVDFRWETASGANHGSRSSATVPTGSWHHVACVYDQTAGENRIYIDGTLVDTTADSGTPTTSTDPLYLGARLSRGSLKNYFDGMIDLARVSAGAIYTADFTPPQQFGSTGTLQQVALTWEAATSGTPAAGYRVYRDTPASADWVLLTSSADLTTTAWTDPAPAPGANCYRVTAVDALDQESAPSDSACVTVVVTKSRPANDTRTVPAGLGFSVQPNPFNPRTAILFRLAEPTDVTLTLYDVRGQRVATLVRGRRAAGPHLVRWNGRDDHGRHVSSGTYFLMLQAGSERQRRKLVVLK